MVSGLQAGGTSEEHRSTLLRASQDGGRWREPHLDVSRSWKWDGADAAAGNVQHADSAGALKARKVQEARLSVSVCGSGRWRAERW